MRMQIAVLKSASPCGGRFGILGDILPKLKRYALSAGGPIAVSAAHFIASLILLRTLIPAEFGLFSFLMIIAPFSLSLGGALIGASFITSLRHAGHIEEATAATHLKANRVSALAAWVAATVAMKIGGATLADAGLLGLYCGAMALRQFGRTFAYADERPKRALFSDLAYAGLLIASLLALLAVHALSLETAAAALAFASSVGVIAFGSAYLLRLIRPGGAGSLADYASHWRDLARWAVLGVVLTECAANAHAYIVTFLAGPKAFALLAVGALVMRPASLLLSSLPDIERPDIARKIGKGDLAGAFRAVKDFRRAAGAVWLGTLFLAGGILVWFPQLLLKKGYDLHQVMAVIALWGVIIALRTLRTPDAVLLQAAGEFRDLAGASLWAGMTSLLATTLFLLLFGPAAALGGILAGELVMVASIFALTRRWKLRHG